MTLKDKRILITAGPTWVPIDPVRVISNTASGETGILLAEKLNDRGAKVTLLLGPTGNCSLNKKIKLRRFRFFDELKKAVKCELASKKYDVVIHSSAVSDYRPVKKNAHKIVSGIRNLELRLVPTEKIIDGIKKIDSKVLLVGFKFQPGADKNSLIRGANTLMLRSGADLIVANTVKKGKYLAYIVYGGVIDGPIPKKKDLTGRLIQKIGVFPWKS